MFAVDDLLRGIDDAEGIRAFYCEPLEELLIDGVEKLLLFRKVRDGVGGGFDGDVEGGQGEVSL